MTNSHELNAKVEIANNLFTHIPCVLAAMSSKEDADNPDVVPKKEATAGGSIKTSDSSLASEEYEIIGEKLQNTRICTLL